MLKINRGLDRKNDARDDDEKQPLDLEEVTDRELRTVTGGAGEALCSNEERSRGSI